jgi:uncharacterized membrane protein YdjX (TVP38/TMEM64 family)
VKKLLALVLIPGIIMAGLFVLWGDQFEAALNQDAFIKEYGQSSDAWLIALGLMISDLFLPIPASGIMAAIGNIYGIGIGLLINFFAFFGAGMLAYIIARAFSSKGAQWLCSAEELETYKAFFDKWGGHSIIISRLFPILPEVTSLLAGFSKMNFKSYTTSLFLGTLPVCAFYTWLGHSTKEEPFWGIIAAVSLPLILWFIFNRYIKLNDINNK